MIDLALRRTSWLEESEITHAWSWSVDVVRLLLDGHFAGVV